MNYVKIYKQLVDSRKLLCRFKSANDGLESHHIIPKSLGRSNRATNKVLLTYREHFLAHALLVHMHDGKDKAKMSYALWMMCNSNDQFSRITSNRQYELAKTLMRENCSGKNHPMYGGTLSDSQKISLRERMLGDNNPSRKYGVWDKGLPSRNRGKTWEEIYGVERAHSTQIKTSSHTH